MLVFGSCGNKVFDLLSVCWVRGSGNYKRKKKDTGVCLAGCAVVLCQFLVLAGNSSQNENTFLQKNLIGLLFYDQLADVCFL